MWVRKLQAALGLLVDGKYGPDTEAALKNWQAEQGARNRWYRRAEYLTGVGG
jgi:peptidoglycan hydrolase-like protein with peptidoglycan-binding domain